MNELIYVDIKKTIFNENLYACKTEGAYFDYRIKIDS